ncbi:hypothetical protein [Aurantimonas sp. 22II-16-19i]|uniref:hypothetical protein n=1 Tax=Aurantimonas sp. 22II-16-19i TaxID=1317114 RepID=UPI0009F7F269|nr:hypothetical protein [Aurantimonas sp. 22II-16-19i]ORE99115.1 hypothetical protein ATO4_02075 [Aurantimonas sp. 22II-16-19i]
MPHSIATRRSHHRTARLAVAAALAIAASTLVAASSARAQPAEKSAARLGIEDATTETIATAGADASLRIAAPLEPTRLSLVLAPSAIDPDETVFIDVYIEPAGSEAGTANQSTPDAATLDAGNASRLAGTVAFTVADQVGEEEYFVVNVPQGMRFEAGAAIVTITLAGADAPLENSGVELRKANLLR